MTGGTPVPKNCLLTVPHRPTWFLAQEENFSVHCHRDSGIHLFEQLDLPWPNAQTKITEHPWATRLCAVSHLVFKLTLMELRA